MRKLTRRVRCVVKPGLIGLMAATVAGCGATVASKAPVSGTASPAPISKTSVSTANSSAPISTKVTYLAPGETPSTLWNGQYVGIELPVGPPIYNQVLNKLQALATVQSGPFTYHVGTLSGEPVVLSVAPLSGITIRSLSTERMETIFHIGSFIYPGTAGSQLKNLTFGDVVLSARVVDTGNYVTSRTGAMVPGTFHNTEKSAGSGKFMYLYSNPTLLNLAYKAASPALLGLTPAKVLGTKTAETPWVMKYGTQGSGEGYLRDPALIARKYQVFHAVAQSGDYPSALASLYNGVPFLEFMTITNATLQVPTTFNAFYHQDALFAQERSNAILLKLLALMHQQHIISPPAANPTQDPYPTGTFTKALTPPARG